MSTSKRAQGRLSGRPELARLGERHIDHQLRASEEQDEKSRHLMTMSGATLVAASAIGGLATQSAEWAQSSWLARLPFALALALSFLFTGWAFRKLALSYVGDPKKPMEWQVGWDPKVIRTASEEGDSYDQVVSGSAWGIEQWAHANSELLTTSYKLRQKAVTMLTWAGLFLSAGLIYAVFAF